MSKPSGSSYRDPMEDEDDLDDLDGMSLRFGPACSADAADVLASFTQPEPKASTSAPPPTQPPPPTQHPQNPPDDSDEDFEASLAEGMESLLRQLAGDHPPGPMPDVKGRDAKEGKINGEEAKALSPEEEEEAWQRAVELMISGEGMSALGLNGTGAGSSRPPKAGAAAGSPIRQPGVGAGPGAGSASPAAHPSFEETIRRTMESLKAGGEGSKGAAGSAAGQPDLARLLEQLGSDPALLDGLGEGEDDELGGLLDGMMGQLMTREVLEEPMSELASKYPPYLAAPPSTVSPGDLAKYRQQHSLVQQILETFRKPDYSDQKDGNEVARLVGEMQDLGGPPEEIMGKLPEGFDLGALGGGEDGCSIM